MNDLRQQFEQVCSKRGVRAADVIGAALQTHEGQVLLEALQQTLQPLDHTFHPDARFAEHHHGRLEVVSLLWLYGTTQRLPAILPTSSNETEEKQES